tara:strand:+ start:1355 stop:1570 length:216 start_codon:yes stop_codon:yes gene_type:complete
LNNRRREFISDRVTKKMINIAHTNSLDKGNQLLPPNSKIREKTFGAKVTCVAPVDFAVLLPGLEDLPALER